MSPSVILETDGGFEEQWGTQKHVIEVKLEFSSVWGNADPHIAPAHNSGSLSLGISYDRLIGHKVQGRIDVFHYVFYVFCPTTVIWYARCLPLGKYTPSRVANVGPIATDSVFLQSLCLLHALSRWPLSLHLLHCAVSFHTRSSFFLRSLLKSRFSASATEPFCPFCLCAVLSWKICSLLLNSEMSASGLKLSC